MLLLAPLKVSFLPGNSNPIESFTSQYDVSKNTQKRFTSIIFAALLRPDEGGLF